MVIMLTIVQTVSKDTRGLSDRIVATTASQTVQTIENRISFGFWFSSCFSRFPLLFLCLSGCVTNLKNQQRYNLLIFESTQVFSVFSQSQSLTDV